MSVKQCKVCEEVKALSEFYVHRRRGKSWHVGLCKGCVSEDNRRRRKAGPVSGYIDVSSKVCTSCNVEKSIEQFSPDLRNRTRSQNRCKICVSSIQRKARRANPAKTILEQVKFRARRNGHQFNLTEEDIVIPDVCPVLGIPLKTGNGRMTANSPSIDRIIPTRGYVKGNVAIISWRANRLKGDGSPEEIELLNQWLQSVVRTQATK